jgi:hypothetical protein
MNDETQAGIRSEVDSIGLELGGLEAWEEVEPWAGGGRQDGGEGGQNLSNPGAIPNWTETIHRRSDENLNGRPRGAEGQQMFTDFTKEWLNPRRDGGR